MSTFIDGIGASSNLDTAGEIIDISGMDISSLAVSGVFNWEHLKNDPSQVVGKILKAKKIFSEKECEDDRELYFWKKCQVPYIYISGELFDDYKDSAKEVAGLFRYDADHPNQSVDVVGFSIEGQYLEKQGSVVSRSIARKCTITTANCNKMAIAKLVPTKKPKDSIDELFKTELVSRAEILKNETPLRKDQPKLTIAPSIPKTPKPIGHTQSGKPISPTARAHEPEYAGFTAPEHHEAWQAHMNAAGAANKAKDASLATHHNTRARLHQAAASSMITTADKRNKPKTPKLASSNMLSNTTTMVKSELVQSLSMDEDTNTLMNRIEDKYVIPKSALDYLTQIIKENLKKGDIDTEVRNNVNRSIYLDTPDLDSLKDALNGKKPRMKVRVRQYSPNGEGWEQIAYVEIKSKEVDGTSNKTRIRIHSKDIESFVSGDPLKISEDLTNINKDITKQILERRIALINHLTSLYGYRKQIEIQYERRAYMDDDVRITIDDKLHYMDCRSISDSNSLAAKSTERWVNILQLDHKIKNEGFLILEVKHQGKIPDWVKKCLKNANAQQVKFSKYCGAVCAVIDTKQETGSICSYIPFVTNIEKALDAGSGLAAPSALVGGAALSVESLDKRLKKPKSKWLSRAEQEYDKWHKKEAFESFMAKRMPSLTKGEVRAIGQTLMLNKSMTLEKALSNLSGYNI